MRWGGIAPRPPEIDMTGERQRGGYAAGLIAMSPSDLAMGVPTSGPGDSRGNRHMTPVIFPILETRAFQNGSRACAEIKDHDPGAWGELRRGRGRST
ncbi:MAG: hypothetical protein SangKO_030920 [Sandaracinaceae bacterium]